MSDEQNQAERSVRKAFHDDDAAQVRKLLEENPALKARLADATYNFHSPPILHVKSADMLDVLLDAGADINARSQWGPGGFGLLDTADPKLAAYAIKRGAAVTVHAAARLGMLDKLKEMIAADPQLVHARGGDGQFPLHFASTVEIAEYLLDHGAEIDARDIDHESTAAQYMLKERPEIARFLIRRGCATDILMAAALDDANLVLKHLDEDPESIRIRVSDEFFPIVGSAKNGGTIYQWVLGWHVSVCQVARSFGHLTLFEFLMDRCPAEEKLLNACWLQDEALVRQLLSQQPDLADRLPASGRRNLAHAARNNDTAAGRLMLVAGLPVDTFSQHHGTPLHWAAWHGNVELTKLLLDRRASLTDSSNDYKGTPLDWAIHGSLNGWFRDTGEYPETVSALLDAGAPLPEKAGGSDEVQTLLVQRGVSNRA